MLLGGRASEEIVIQDISTGASSDIKRASEIARKMVCEWGMSDALPNLFFGGDQEVFIGRDYQTQNSYSDDVASIIDKEIQKIIDTNYKRAIECLKGSMDTLDRMVKLLYERETIYGDEVEMLMNGKSVAEVSEYIEGKLAAQREQNERQKPIITPVFDSASTIIVKEEDVEKPEENLPGENDKNDGGQEN